jgi:two-component system OmpR family response regulator
MKHVPLKILYVEDDPDTIELIGLVLSKEGYEVEVTDKGREALRLARTKRFDAYLIDNWLPDITGLELCGQLREIDPRIPIIFFSGAASDADREAALACGAAAYLIKPAGLGHLPNEIMRIISTAIAAHA